MKALYFSSGQAPAILRFTVGFSAEWISRLFPRFFAKLSFKVFMNPYSKRDYQFNNLTPEEHSVSGKHGEIKTYFFNGGEKHILLTHGWADTSKSFETIIQKLLEEGYSVWCFDHAGHGKSAGKISNAFAFVDGLTNAILYIQSSGHELHGLISHSMGGLAILNLNEEYLSHKKIVLIAAPVKFFEEMFNTFKRIGISAKVLTQLLNYISNYYNGQWEKLKPVEQKHKMGENFYIVHDQKDKQCKYENMMELMEGTGAQLKSSDGLGHRRILRDPATLDSITHFLQ